MSRRGPKRLNGRVPAWWADAKLGIFVHWTPASVAGWAPTDVEIGDLLASGRPDHMAAMPYTEWYENSLRYPDSPVSQFHRDTYGDRPYREFGADFEAGLEHWDPAAWAQRFRAAGARYVVLVAKHHDGFCLWPTQVRHPHGRGWGTKRDVVGELAEAVRAEGLRFGLYYSGGLDWTFEPRPVGSTAEVVASVPGGEYPAYAVAQVRELIERYRPSVLWNDIAWPTPLPELVSLLDDYKAAVPDGVVNDRWLPRSPALKALQFGPARRALDKAVAKQVRKAGGLLPPPSPVFDFRTPEYVVFDEVPKHPWECVRGIDRSFGFNRASAEAEFLSRAELLDMAADIAAKGGNLLLNVGPRGEDAQIPDAQLQRLDWLGEWAASAADGLYATKPWVRPSATSAEGHPLRFTARGDDVFVHVLADGVEFATVPDVLPTAATSASVGDRPAAWSSSSAGLAIELPAAAGHPVVALHQVEVVTSAIP